MDKLGFKPWNQAHAVIQYKKSGDWYVFDFGVPADSDEEKILKAIHRQALEARYHYMDLVHNPWTRVGRLPPYWIHFVEVHSTVKHKMSIRYATKRGTHRIEDE
jgi:small-conductance mechanosensitive channel